MPLAAAAALALLSQLPALLAEPVAGLALPGLRLAAAALAAAVCFALPDRMASTVMAPSPRWIRQWLRVALVLLPATTVWVLLYLAMVAVNGRLVVGPTGHVTMQAVVYGLIPLAAAAVTAQYRARRSGSVPILNPSRSPSRTSKRQRMWRHVSARLVAGGEQHDSFTGPVYASGDLGKRA
ncbi:hypothetical protein [Micromonospora coerulea]|uniref:hypothetical protein n=1 Tax=Micromonospora coerulea TaxID=47856 RepID=UPI001902F65F|nr:hypothetical protein [Micromonospora veneta]